MCGFWNETNYPIELNKYPKLLPMLMNEKRNKFYNGYFTYDYIDNCFFHLRCGSTLYNDISINDEQKANEMIEIFELFNMTPPNPQPIP